MASSRARSGPGAALDPAAGAFCASAGDAVSAVNSSAAVVERNRNFFVMVLSLGYEEMPYLLSCGVLLFF